MWTLKLVCLLLQPKERSKKENYIIWLSSRKYSVSASSHKQQSTVNMLINSNSLFSFRANQSLLLLLTAVCLAKKQKIPIIVFGLTRTHDLTHSRQVCKPLQHNCSLFYKWYYCYYLNKCQHRATFCIAILSI